MSNKPYLSVIIPAYNEADNLDRGSLTLVIDYLKHQHFTWELIIVDDGSTDDTNKLLQEFTSHHKNIRLLSNAHKGKAASIISGVKESQGQVILFTDMDQATPATEFDKFIPLINSGYQIVIGSRSGRPNAPIVRKILAYGMIICRALILRLPFKDTQCGFKAFTREAAISIFIIMDRVHSSQTISGPAVNPGFDVEMLFLGRKLGYKIAEVPVTWRHQESRRVSFVKDAIAGLQGLLLVRVRSLFNTYGLKN